MSPSSNNLPNPTVSNSTYPHFQPQPFSHSYAATDQFNYPTKADIFGPSPNDSLVRYEFDVYQDPTLAQNQVAYSAHLAKQQQQQQKLQQPPPPQSYVTNGMTLNGGMPYLNGGHLHNGPTFPPPHHHHHPAQHPLLHAPGPGPGNASQQQSTPQQVQPQPPQQSSKNDQNQEEISTIFVVGFPDDMQEREFQNMFTFSNGFEAATLKIPNKDSSAYGSTAGASGATNTLRQAGYISQQHHGASAYSGAQDPYNLVTANSGGVLVDGPQGPASSWHQPNLVDAFNIDLQQQQQIHPPPRKQIIGFAKFRSRQEALEARDVLQGRRVDIEKGAVLKAEMAKKNLHTKRGVGPLGLPVGLVPPAPSTNANGSAVTAGSIMGPSELIGGNNTPGLGYTNGTLVGLVPPAPSGGIGEPLTARDRQLGALDAMGLGSTSLNRRQQQHQEEEKESEQREKRAMSISTTTTAAAPRDEQEQERIRKEKDVSERKLRMSNPTLYDAFHLAPNSSGNRSNLNGNSTVLGFHDTSTTFPGYSLVNGLHSGNSTASSSVASSASTLHTTSGNGDIYSSLQLHHQPLQLPQAHNSTAPGTPWNLTMSNTFISFDVPYSERRVGYSSSSDIDTNGALSPPDLNTPLPPIIGSQISRSHSPSNESQPYHQVTGFAPISVGSTSSFPRSGSSSIADGSHGSSRDSFENEFSRTLTVSTEHGMTSPQLPSPGSGASSAGGPTSGSTGTLSSTGVDGRHLSNVHSRPHFPGNASDQNPPPPLLVLAMYRVSKTVLQTEEQWSDFEDVNYATKAMHDLYGHQLNGLVKGGIRLSFSKNPLGVRPANLTPHNQRNGHQQPPQGSHQSPITAPSIPVNFSIHPAFQTRSATSDVAAGGVRPILRHHDSSSGLDATELGSSNPTYSYSVSPPPTSRFFSPPPSSSFGAVGTASGVGFSAAINVGSSSMSSASSTTSSTSASGAPSAPGFLGPSSSGNSRSTAPPGFGLAPFSPPLSVRNHSPPFGINVNVGVLSSAQDNDDRVKLDDEARHQILAQDYSIFLPEFQLTPAHTKLITIISVSSTPLLSLALYILISSPSKDDENERAV
ncbi:hypothetical protein Clacol_001451 [Clathrus columnatus]|uniref:RRM domain-containing protein n=1 Tax=Clathrus columnatus TaxID=1419009 RepID=A0AAV5A3U3_9AGAM|nr:hypothetical protein Clacol_001451 [Clathrus columnatus]